MSMKQEFVNATYGKLKGGDKLTGKTLFRLNKLSQGIFSLM
jgi:hypothetical protein